MWSFLLETAAEAFGVTRRTRVWVFAGVVVGALGLTTLAFAEGGPRGLVALVVLAALGFTAASHVVVARRNLWRAARGNVETLDRSVLEGPPLRDLPPTSAALHALTRAVTFARLGRFLDATATLDLVDTSRLREDEERLLAATRAMVSLGLGEFKLAAEQARRALPTLSEDIDEQLGRALIAEAWRDPERLRSIDEAWAESGVSCGMRFALPRLRAVVRLRIDETALDATEPWEAKALADEARAIGDEALAADLEARVRPTAYR